MGCGSRAGDRVIRSWLATCLPRKKGKAIPAAFVPAYDDPIWCQTDREFWREEGVSLTTGEVIGQGHAATRCSYCGTVDDDPPEEIEDHCDECGQNGYISSGYAVYFGLALYFLGTE